MNLKSELSGSKFAHQRSLVHGVGVNNADYIVRNREGGKKVLCPVYAKWVDMLTRCYSGKFKSRCQTYVGCSVCDEWLTFSNFSVWFKKNNIEGYHLDKDIKIVGNKIYSPDTCLFIPSELNHLLADSASIRGDFPIGVALYKRTGRFISSIRINGSKKHLGYFDTPSQAHEAYCKAKNAEIARKCRKHPEFEVHLIKHILKSQGKWV